MSVILYNNGIIEEYKPENLVFTEDELVKMFTEYEEIKTCRIIPVVNAWCIYGKSLSADENEYNKLASEVSNEDIYSHAIFVHDSEINPKWNATDNIIYNNYTDFNVSIRNLIDNLANQLMTEQNSAAVDEEGNEKEIALPQLVSVGATTDKRVLFEYTPENQTDTFYKDEAFNKFSRNVYDFLIANHPKKEQFIIYADKKSIIYVPQESVEEFLNTIINNFTSKEDYERCTLLSNMLKSWNPVNIEKPKRKRRAKKSE